MNTLENEQKFVAQYWGQKVQYYPLTGNLYTVFDVSVDNSYLELKPLSSISDEDSITLWKAIWGDNVVTKNRIKEIKERLIELSYNSKFTDKARELGYACNWNGITVEQQIEYGWIKLKES